jgi:hypothetical protein
MAYLGLPEDTAPESRPDVAIAESPTVGLGSWGIALTLVGAVIMGLAVWVYDPSIASNDVNGLPDRIVNTGLLQTQMMIFLFGCACFASGLITGAIAVGTKSIRLQQIRRN